MVSWSTGNGRGPTLSPPFCSTDWDFSLSWSWLKYMVGSHCTWQCSHPPAGTWTSTSAPWSLPQPFLCSASLLLTTESWFPPSQQLCTSFRKSKWCLSSKIHLNASPGKFLFISKYLQIFWPRAIWSRIICWGSSLKHYLQDFPPGLNWHGKVWSQWRSCSSFSHSPHSTVWWSWSWDYIISTFMVVFGFVFKFYRLNDLVWNINSTILSLFRKKYDKVLLWENLRGFFFLDVLYNTLLQMTHIAF